MALAGDEGNDVRHGPPRHPGEDEPYCGFQPAGTLRDADPEDHDQDRTEGREADEVVDHPVHQCDQPVGRERATDRHRLLHPGDSDRDAEGRDHGRGDRDQDQQADEEQKRVGELVADSFDQTEHATETARSVVGGQLGAGVLLRSHGYLAPSGRNSWRSVCRDDLSKIRHAQDSDITPLWMQDYARVCFRRI